MSNNVNTQQRTNAMIITRKSLLSGITRSIELPVLQEQIDAWQSGTFIQDAMPQLNDADREFILSGITA